jgi:bacillolysin
MADPNQFGDPDTYKGTNWYTGTGDYGGVHYNSGVQNKWFYILTTGESGTNDNGYSYSVTGIGLDKASRIAYRNLTVYLTASSNYAVARAGALQSATDLYGALSDEVTATAEAWNAVGVYAPAPDTQAPTAPVLSSTSKTQTTIALSWTAATDNVGVTGYDVYVNAVKNNTSNLTARTYTINGLTSGTQYSIYVVAKDAAGNTKSSNILSITTTGSMVETLVKAYYFETSLDSWIPSSTTNCTWTNNPTYAYEGNGSVLVQSRSTNATSPLLPLTGYSQVEVKFYFTAVGMETSKSFVLSYSSNSGTSFSTVATFTSAATATGTKFVTDKGFYVATVTMNSTSFNARAKFRIQNNGSNTTDKIYFDAVTITGRTNTSGSGNTVTLAAVTKPGIISESLKGNFADSESILKEDSEMILYPNPVVKTLNIMTQEKITAIRIYSSNGSVIRTVQSSSDANSIDLSTLVKGVYFVAINTDRGTVIKKIIKQ